MTDPERLHPPYRDEPGWRHEPQAQMLTRPLAWWRRLDLWYLALVATSVCGVSVCLWGMLYGMTEGMVWLLVGLVMIELGLLSREAQR